MTSRAVLTVCFTPGRESSRRGRMSGFISFCLVFDCVLELLCLSGDLRNSCSGVSQVFPLIALGCICRRAVISATFEARFSPSVSSSTSPPGHRFEDVPGVRRHLVRKSTKGQIVHIGKDHKEPSTRSRKQDRTPHEVKSCGHCFRQDAFIFFLF